MNKTEELQTEKERIGLFGGTFNPIHVGHLRAAEEIHEFFHLDKIIFIPARIPPHKTEKAIIAPDHRLNMVKLAIQDNPRFEVSNFEIQRDSKSYSIITIEHFQKKLGLNTSLFFLMGMDAFLEINTWKDFSQLFSLTNFIIMSRPGYHKKASADLFSIDGNKNFAYNPEGNYYTHSTGHKLFFQEITLLDFSSRAIRSRLKGKRSIRYLVPPVIENYIKKHGLYDD
ncbi:MAG: nicotinate-nucleotide adenylyltransferase [Thermodesulfobacteriota bacterium]|nr:MAG: nicotinate-nucleotide adenylyltransferase [Thermodesulfobacteriota bacterium]